MCGKKSDKTGAQKGIMLTLAPYKSHLSSYKSLITPYKEIRAGFIALALEKSAKASPFIEEAKTLKALASKADEPKDLLNMRDIKDSLLTASGVSEKAKNHLEDQDKRKSVINLIKNFLEPAGNYFIDELVYRFLLVKGDSVGGVIRNFAGAAGERKFTKTLVSLFSLKGQDFMFLGLKEKKWVKIRHGKRNSALDLDKRVKGLCWAVNGKTRVLIYNLTVPMVKKNVDLCLFDGSPEDLKSAVSLYANTEKYLALGELKGGTDPAGADEHWKTANSALDRIRRGFFGKKRQPLTFFIGAAIEKSMAKEIYQQLEEGVLSNGANLTSKRQIVSLGSWLINI